MIDCTSEILLNTSLGLTIPFGGGGGGGVTLGFGLFPQITWSPGTLTSARGSQGPVQFPYFFPEHFLVPPHPPGNGGETMACPLVGFPPGLMV